MKTADSTPPRRLARSGGIGVPGTGFSGGGRPSGAVFRNRKKTDEPSGADGRMDSL